MPYDNKWHRAVIACTSQLSLGGRAYLFLSKERGPASAAAPPPPPPFPRASPRKCKSKTKKRRRGIKRRGGQRNELELYEYEIRGGGWLVPKPNLRQRSVLLNVLLSTNVLCKYPVGIFFPPLRKSEDVSTIDIIICTSCTRSGLFSFLRAIIRSWSAILPSPWSYSFSSSSFFSAALWIAD